jgi:hypothetical protein
MTQVTKLAGHVISVGEMDPDKFLPVLTTFGPLPDDGQRELAERLVGGVGAYRLCFQMKGPRPAEEREQLKRVAELAEILLKKLGVKNPLALSTDPAESQPRSWTAASLLVELYKLANERRPAMATLTAHERWTALLLLLSNLKEAAERCAPMAMQRSPRGSERRGRGGVGRWGTEAKGRLLHSCFETYAALRLRYPNSGASLACDDSLKAFVRAVLTLAASSAPPFSGPDGLQYQLGEKVCGVHELGQTTDAAIKNAFHRWENRSKRKNV